MENFGKQLNRLIKICNETQEIYHKAAEDVGSVDLKNRFNEIARHRQNLVSELKTKLSTYGIVQPDEKNDLIGSLHRAWMNVKTAMSSRGERGIIEMCRDTDQAALDAYDDVLQGEILYSDLKPFLVNQRTAISEEFLEVDKKYFEYFPPAQNEL